MKNTPSSSGPQSLAIVHSSVHSIVHSRAGLLVPILTRCTTVNNDFPVTGLRCDGGRKHSPPPKRPSGVRGEGGPNMTHSGGGVTRVEGLTWSGFLFVSASSLVILSLRSPVETEIPQRASVPQASKGRFVRKRLASTRGSNIPCHTGAWARSPCHTGCCCGRADPPLVMHQPLCRGQDNWGWGSCHTGAGPACPVTPSHRLLLWPRGPPCSRAPGDASAPV